MSLLSHVHGHFKQYGLLKLLQESSNDMRVDYLASGHALEVDWCLSQSSWYPYYFDTGEAICVAASIEPGQNLQSDGAASAKRNPSAIPGVFVNQESTSQSAAK